MYAPVEVIFSVPFEYGVARMPDPLKLLSQALVVAALETFHRQEAL
jgi:hypothetical protein